MRVCFYCGLDDHKAPDCPSRAIVEVSNLPKALMQAQREREYLDNLARQTLKEILNAKLSDPALETKRNIAALQGLLFIGFVEIEKLSKELEKIYHLLSAYLPHPVRTEAQDLYKIGVTMLRRGFHEEAERKLLEAKGKDPSSFAIYVALGQVCVETERDSKALEYFELAERNADEPKQRAFALLLQGRCLMTMGSYDYEEAQDRLTKGVKLTPETGLMWYALAQGAGVAGNSERCLRALQESIKLDACNYVRALLDPFMDPVSTEIQEFCAQLSLETYNLAAKEVKRLENGLKELKKLRVIIFHKYRTKEFQYAQAWFLPSSCSTLAQAVSSIKPLLSPTKYLPSRMLLDMNLYHDLVNIRTTIQLLLVDHVNEFSKTLEEGPFRDVDAGLVLVAALLCSPLLIIGLLLWLFNNGIGLLLVKLFFVGVVLVLGFGLYSDYRWFMQRLEEYWSQQYIADKHKREDMEIKEKLLQKIQPLMNL